MVKKLQALKARKGFTLVELIVVIAIIAVLAAILVPVMLGYVAQSRVTSANSTAADLKDSVNTWIVQRNSDDDTLVSSPEGTFITFKIVVTNGIASLSDEDNTTNLEEEDFEKLLEKINNDHSFKIDAFIAYIDHTGKCVALTYSAMSGATFPTYDGTTWAGNWDSTNEDKGYINGIVIGTFPAYDGSYNGD